jgi:hypothetical protein
MLSTPAVSRLHDPEAAHPLQHLGEARADLVGRHVEGHLADRVGHVLGGIDDLVAEAGRRITE